MNFKARYLATAALVICLAFAPSKCFARSGLLVVGNDQTSCPLATFSQIQTAINQASPGDSIHICNGVYAEQLSIGKSLDIDADEGVLLAPQTVNQNTTGLASGVPIAAVIFVSGAMSVSISGLTIDAINTSIAECAPRLEGIYFQNASGRIDGNVVRNVKLRPGLEGCQSGTGILVESGNGGSSHVEITNNRIHDFQKNGITANEFGTDVSIRENTVTGLGPTTGAAQNGIQIGFGASGEVLQNTVANTIWSPCTDSTTCAAVATNILIVNSDGIRVRENTITTAQVGIFAIGNGDSISKNRVSNSLVFDGIRIEGNNANVAHNRVETASEALIFIQGDDNDVEHNRLSDAPVGILKATGSTANTFENNKFENVATDLLDPLPTSIAALLIPER